MPETTRHIWTVRPVDERDPSASFTVWSSDDGRIYAELGATYELVKPKVAATESYVQQWEDELPVHPIVEELRAQPGRWARISMDTYIALKTSRPPNVQLGGGLVAIDRVEPRKARWLPDPVVAAMQVLKGGAQ
jgi:hypothetical protein